MVSPGTAGVPSGGRYGDVHYFVTEAEKHGLYVCWSRIFECFGIYTKDGMGKYTFQLLWRNAASGEAKPLSRTFLWLMLHFWDEHCRTTGKLLEQAFAQANRDEKSRIAKERYELATDVAKDAVDETWVQRGHTTRKMISIPRMGVGRG